MQKIETKIEGVYILEPNVFSDERGEFIKVFNKEIFEGFAFDPEFKESYFSTSKKDVIRGMHFQTPPADHAKLVYVTSGAIMDVVLDIRKGSPSFGHYITEELSEKNHKIIYVPTGCAHGFLSLRNNSLVTYLQTTTYSKENDAGINIDSFGFDWGIKKPIVSARDQSHPHFQDFDSPFVYKK